MISSRSSGQRYGDLKLGMHVPKFQRPGPLAAKLFVRCEYLFEGQPYF